MLKATRVASAVQGKIVMSLSQAELYALWSPPESRWSVWSKPVLFANAPVRPSGKQPELPGISGLHRLRDAAVIVDVPGAYSVLLGLALAQIGFQPVPLYNSAASAGQVVQMDDIADMLAWGPAFLRQKTLKSDTPPVFLLNSDRLDHSGGANIPGRFDNRWAVVPQDMPSAAFLKAAGLTRVVVVSSAKHTDLAHILYSYARAGLKIERAATPNNTPTEFQVQRPMGFRSLWYRLGVFAGLRRNAAGGFGALVPDPGEMSGGGGWG